MVSAGWMIYGSVCAVMSVVTFLAYGWDKRQARGGRRRVAVRTLHMLELFGGWAGGLAARRFWRHKSRQRAFRRISATIILLHLLALSAGLVSAAVVR